MRKIERNSLAAVEFELQWRSDIGTHTDCFFAAKLNFWRDILPKPLFEKLMNLSFGDFAEHRFVAGEILPGLDPSKQFRIKHAQFEGNSLTGRIIHPCQGRFYPKGMVRDCANVFRTNVEPFRCAEVTDSGILVDFNHPLSGRELHVKASVRDIMTTTAGMGGACIDWMQILTEGPGMQARWNGQPTDFFSDTPFERSDELPDARFYEKPRFVNHLDDTAIALISGLYGRMLRDGDRVLDLMSSWTSHLPSRLTLKNLTGLGLNPEELGRNERLTHALIHDLNEKPVLPFDDASFDAVICTVSVEYLTQPVAVFQDAGRILRPGGCFITTFSNRWFPPKAVNVWRQIHEFERMGLVSEYFLLSGEYRDIHTLSIRGLPRPEDDKYRGELSVSDPVYGVWAYRR